MPHCFKLARRLSRLRPALVRPSPSALTLPRRPRLLVAASLLGLGIIGCTEDEQLTTGPEATIENPGSTAADTTTDSTTVIVTDSIGDGIDSSLAAANTGTTIYPGQDIQAKVSSYPGGTTFTLKAGIHRLQSITPKNGNSFAGEPGAILSGARLLTTFTRQGSYWVASGQTQQGLVKVQGGCDATYPRCAYPEELFINGVRHQHMASLAAVGPGKWYFDYAADKIYFQDDPTGKKVEISVKPYAFQGPASGVTISGLIVEKYASPTGRGAIGGYGSGPNWVVRDSEIRHNHGGGIRTGNGMRVLRNHVHHQGQIGILGPGDNLLVEGNEIAWNNTDGFTDGKGSETGGAKLARTNGLIVRGNFSHHNHGAGLHTDLDNINTLYENNRVEDNDWRGIFHEVSYKATIRNNICRRNGLRMAPGPKFSVDGAGILISTSRDVEVYGNTVEGNRAGIGGLQTNRGSGKYGHYDLANLYVHDNTVRLGNGRTGVVQNVGSNAVFNGLNNRYVNNDYDLGTELKPFQWMNANLNAVGWKSYGLDVNGTF
jgi:parallel beta-helix repeat protein